jgi:hypothetical protein
VPQVMRQGKDDARSGSVSKVGRPGDGSDPKVFSMFEAFVDLKSDVVCAALPRAHAMGSRSARSGSDR